MKSNLDSLKFVVTYREGTEIKRSTFSSYDVALGYFEEKQELYDSVKLSMEHTITTEVRIK
jgi:hypothetical protein